MRTPVPREPTDTPRVVPLRPGPQEPDAKFIADLTMAIRAGARPSVAARWLGVRKNTWKNWRLRQGEPYDTLRASVRHAVAHLEVNLMANLAKKSPGVALKELRSKADSPDRQRYLARMAKEKPWEMLGLTYREELFCRELLATNENAYEAVLRVGTFKASTKGSRKNLASRLMRKPKIIARVAQLKREALAVVERKTRFKMSGERVLEKYASFINADIRRISPVDAHGMTIVPSDQWHDDDADAVKSISQTPDGMIKVELHSPIPALEFYARMFFPENVPPPMQGGVIVQQGVILIPDNGRDPLLAIGGKTTNGHSSDRTPGPEPPQHPTAIIDFPPRDEVPRDDVGRRDASSNGDQPHDGGDDLERDLGLS